MLHPGWKLFLAQHIRPLVDRYRGKLLGTEDIEPADRLAMIRTLKELSNRLQGPYVDGGVEVPQHLQNWLS